jgi:chemotaxis family two-component system sensor kinase Cph1
LPRGIGEIQIFAALAQLRLIFADRGIGRVPARSGFGFRILNALVKQLRGTLTQSDNRPGLRIEVVMPAVPNGEDSWLP